MVNNLPAVLAHMTGVPADPAGPFTVRVNNDGNQVIDTWDVEALGERPTDAEIEIADAEYSSVASARQAAIDLQATDAGMSRVTEDLIATLVGKGVLALEDLPAAAQTKIADRAELRATLKSEGD